MLSSEEVLKLWPVILVRQYLIMTFSGGENYGVFNFFETSFLLFLSLRLAQNEPKNCVLPDNAVAWYVSALLQLPVASPHN